MNIPPGLIVSVSGIRGRVGIDLSPELVASVAAVYGRFVRDRGWGNRLAVARDSRPSGPAYAAAVIAGLEASGCRAGDLGLVPTPTALLEIESGGFSGGIVVTASHNPSEWNALKLASPEGAFLTPQQGSEFVARLKAADAVVSPPAIQGEVERVEGAVERHKSRILALDLIDADAIRRRGFSVALDAARGAGGVILPSLLEQLGCHVVGIELEPDGRFTREPEPIPANLGALREVVAREGCDLGMAVDPDVDRLALVDGRGEAIGEDYTLAFAARLVLARRPGPTVANLSTSQIVEAICREAGTEYVQAPVGEANVAAAMREVEAVVGGEGNGGVMLPALHYTRDAPLAVALILQLLSDTEASLEQLVDRYPHYHIVKDRVSRGEVELEALLGEIERAFEGAEVDRRDGLYLRWREAGSWLHVRPSGTEPIVRLIAEALDEHEASALVERAKGLVGEVN